jgi:hypothetical protein
MKPRAQFIIIVGMIVLILGIAWYTFPERNRAVAQTFPATIQRDCAPWDGAAFTVDISLQRGDVISISIWQAPEIRSPRTFSFPDATGQVGNASLMRSGGLPEQLSGKVFFLSVNQGSRTQGKFELSTESGQHFAGEFQAEWDDQIVLCG